MYTAMKLLYGRGLALKTAVVTDGRFSGTNNGCFVGHVSPEAAEGGPLAAVRDGDPITIDIPGAEPAPPRDRRGDPERLAGWKTAGAEVHQGLPGPLLPAGRIGGPGGDHPEQILIFGHSEYAPPRRITSSDGLTTFGEKEAFASP